MNASLVREYISVRLADLLDDVQCDPSTIITRDQELTKMSLELGLDVADALDVACEVIAQSSGFYASGAPRLEPACEFCGGPVEWKPCVYCGASICVVCYKDHWCGQRKAWMAAQDPQPDWEPVQISPEEAVVPF